MTVAKCLASLSEGMDRSASDKARILPHVKPGRILDIGCGNGAVLDLLSGAFPTSTVEGVDYDARMLCRALDRPYPYQNVSVRRGDVNGFEDWPCRYDTIVLCSCLHEAIPVRDAWNRSDYGCAMVANIATRLLNPGGRLIVRDGVRPVSRKVRLSFPNPSVAWDWQLYARTYKAFPVSWSWISDPGEKGEVLTDSIAAYEFLTKYIYAGTPNWAHEMTEAYGWTTAERLGDTLTRDGLTVIAEETYTVPYLADRWASDVVVRDWVGHAPVKIDSTMLVVTEKRA